MAKRDKGTATIGDNSSHAFAKDKLKSIIERAEKLNEEKAAIGQDLTDLFAEAKGQGYDTRAIKTIIKMRKQDADERAEQAAILDLYMSSLGMLASTPLGQAAIERATAPTRTRQPAALDVGKILDAG